MKYEILVKVFERSIEFHSTDNGTLRWISLEIERNHSFLGNPRVLSIRGQVVQINGFSDHNHACNCATWVEGLLLNEGWTEDTKVGRPRNEKWYKKSVLKNGKS
ncbi:hypothetical protein A2434_00010 [Candidatus Woesebacteria bacterium RIFOXYC1_FULL_41_14]|uniref:Uncharacterized protein n=5 Tax=Candidatus Woeseibacteriota TaxID=1752722 RepID=A0A0G0UZU8_9BACT|nr:MAG: hypothetical protein UT76_C0019G0010 [Candidatus Woesebacteria bacterium GW2011_GWB1_40_12]KKR55842.1 MAG: hypothetical protein UT93_C0013G0011 [Candidatus Woesebacteria bacterium GW2011_GWF1_40_24]KKS03199.1 MAG: hypothetical protein UU57_C0037G0010 [Candidatus Woesebacteria bacterium GW2011_GWE1_41_24]OGM80928.1 MAG: hypothetical protein A2393_00590 [Candidatus Woesebacteria bacterium RIFOXYB1_FULL_41_13]OGM84012.1 MAG: hypothetical protein A2434_00010 [Candidatus Woesebacteria bacter